MREITAGYTHSVTVNTRNTLTAYTHTCREEGGRGKEGGRVE